jgi:hypothetical protein
VLIGIGVAVTIEWAGILEVPWHLLLPLTVILIGIAHFTGARGRRHGGLTFVGMALIIALATSDVVDVPFADRLTESQHTITLEGLDPAYDARTEHVAP